MLSRNNENITYLGAVPDFTVGDHPILSKGEAGTSTPVFILDDYPGSKASYSMRLLSSVYVGDCVRVRRDSDNLELDIGFDGSVIDVSALVTFSAGTDSYVTTWYDQSGTGNDAIQNVASSQPKLYDSITGVELKNGKPAITFDGISDFLDMGYKTPASIMSVYTVANSNGNDNFIFGSYSIAGVERNYLGRSSSGIGLGYGSSNYNTFNSLIDTSNQFLASAFFDGTTGTGYVDGSNEYSNTPTTTNPPSLDFYLGGGNNGSGFGQFDLDGVVQEFIIYETFEPLNRTIIESDMNGFYSVY